MADNSPVLFVCPGAPSQSHAWSSTCTVPESTHVRVPRVEPAGTIPPDWSCSRGAVTKLSRPSKLSQPSTRVSNSATLNPAGGRLVPRRPTHRPCTSANALAGTMGVLQVLLLVRYCCCCNAEKAHSCRCGWTLRCRVAIRRMHRMGNRARRRFRHVRLVLLHRRVLLPGRWGGWGSSVRSCS